MNAPPVPVRDLPAFRFQMFYDDVVRWPAAYIRQVTASLKEPMEIELSESTRRLIFAQGELQEGIIMAALGAAGGVFPRDQVLTMLNRTNPGVMLGRMPAPVNELPTFSDAVQLSERDIGQKASVVMPTVVNAYASLMRQIHRNRFLSIFNVELLFATDAQWQAQLESFMIGAREWIDGGPFLPDSLLYLPEGLDAYFELGQDVGGEPLAALFGRYGDFHNAERTAVDIDEIIDSVQQGNEPALSRIVAWRFGGRELFPSAMLRAQELSARMNEIVAFLARTVSFAAPGGQLGFIGRDGVGPWLA